MEENKNMTVMEKFILYLKNNPDHAYDFILNETYNFSKEELSRISAELLYGVHEMQRIWTISKTEEKNFYDSVSEELADIYNLDFSEED